MSATRTPRTGRYKVTLLPRLGMLLVTTDGGAIVSNAIGVESTQSERGVPSSANWKPTNPLTSRHQHAAVVRPHCTATKYGYTTDASGTTPESRMSEMTVSAM